MIMILLKHNKRGEIHMREWWKEAIGYQIYPSSFGDFKKIIDQIPEDDDMAVVCKLPKNSLF